VAAQSVEKKWMTMAGRIVNNGEHLAFVRKQHPVPQANP
jgi:hypothetical protein